MMRYRRMLAVLGLVGAASLPALMGQTQAQPSADQVLADMGLSPHDKQRVLNGEFVTADVGAVSDRDLSFAIAFLVKTSPASLAKQIVAGELVTADAQVQTHGRFSAAGSLADLAGLKITDGEAKALANAQAGEALNLSTAEIAAFKALSGGTTQAIQQQLQRILLARYQAYRASGSGRHRALRSRRQHDRPRGGPAQGRRGGQGPAEIPARLSRGPARLPESDGPRNAGAPVLG